MSTCSALSSARGVGLGGVLKRHIAELSWHRIASAPVCIVGETISIPVVQEYNW